ncbi:DNA replication/repair protein RecF [Agaribacter marinus]|uniref:DNA replication and repair protein RecF n=1 Tax=Agaribacter marinus TaxID=1431249 RepID=A0AA37SZ64_9ALTE|nr:DNA replication/repair protein RecF [Agaribacter marinus]GLR71264.1 DNA replication and repair protein RecF [Agaribacter marinus]
MHINQLRLTNFRNFSQLDLSPSPTINFIYGANGAGKSSILEAIHVLGFGRSFRTNKPNSIINASETNVESATVFSNYEALDTTHKIGFSRSRQDGFTFNIDGEKSVRVGDIVRKVPVQIFTPQSSELIVGSPSLRRKYIDWLLFHVEQSFYLANSSYTKVLKQRNAFLKSTNVTGIGNTDFFDSWLPQLENFGLRIDAHRKSYINDLNKELITLYAQFRPEINVEIRYNQGWDKDSSLSEALNTKLERDLIRGFTSVGPHKADLVFLVDGKPASEFLSRGQLRVFVSLLLIAEVKLLKRKTNKNTIFLVDDISAELDDATKEFFLDKAVEDSTQLFVTAIEKDQLSFIEKYKNKKVFHVKHNSVFEE